MEWLILVLILALPVLRLMLLPLTLLLTACAGNSPASSAAPPAVPALPLEARQGEVRPLCSPTCSRKWSEKAEQWRQRLTGVE